jgi:energy-coupling factor transport system substrate-specific component
VPHTSLVFLLTVACLAVNVGLNYLNHLLDLPFFFDSIGTSIAAVSLGLVPGLFVAVATNASFELVYGIDFTNLPFAICGILTVFLVRAFLLGQQRPDLGGVLLASLVVALVNAIVGGIIATFLFDGITGVGVDFVVTGMVASGRSLFTAAFWARVPANLFDKSLAVFAAWALMNPMAHLLSRGAILKE